MFIFNFKVNGNKFSKLLFIFMIIIIIIILCIGIYNIFFKKEFNNGEIIKVTDTLQEGKVFEIKPENYTNILKATNEDIDAYIGCKIHFSGYIYRLIDFNPHQFVLARDMLVSKSNKQALVVGFLCDYENALEYKDGTWVDVIGEIKKGEFNGDIAVLNILSIEKIDEPEDKFVYPPDNEYIPTNNMF